VVEPVEELRIVVGSDRPGARTAGRSAQEAPRPIGQTRQHDDEEYELQHENLLLVNIRAVGRLGPVAGTEDRGEASSRPGSRMVVDVLVYTIARILLVGVLGVVIYVGGGLLGIRDFPIVVAALFAVVIAFPAGIWLFAPLRRRATASIAVFDERRRHDREELRARLSGDQPPTG
jgi:hypothetical protein